MVPLKYWLYCKCRYNVHQYSTFVTVLPWMSVVTNDSYLPLTVTYHIIFPTQLNILRQTVYLKKLKVYDAKRKLMLSLNRKKTSLNNLPISCIYVELVTREAS
jgi:hypothetical protein